MLGGRCVWVLIECVGVPDSPRSIISSDHNDVCVRRCVGVMRCVGVNRVCGCT